MSLELESASPLRRRLSVLMSAGVLALGGGAAAGCGGEESAGSEAAGGGPPAPSAEDVPADQQPSEVTLAEILANPQQYTGQQVTVSGEVSQVVVQPGAFTLGAGVETEGEAEGPVGGAGESERPGAAQEGLGAEGGDGQLVVLPTQSGQLPQGGISEGDIVRVQGTVQLISANIAQEDEFLFENTGDTAFLQQFQNQPALTAMQVELDTPAQDQGEESPPGE